MPHGRLPPDLDGFPGLGNRTQRQSGCQAEPIQVRKVLAQDEHEMFGTFALTVPTVTLLNVNAGGRRQPDSSRLY